MRIYNATNSQMNLPFPGGTVSIAPHSVSGNLGANTSTISMLVSAYNTEEIAFIVGGPFELNLCSSIPTVVNYVVQSLEDAIERLEPKPEVKEIKVEHEPESIDTEKAKEDQPKAKKVVVKEKKGAAKKAEEMGELENAKGGHVYDAPETFDDSWAGKDSEQSDVKFFSSAESDEEKPFDDTAEDSAKE